MRFVITSVDSRLVPSGARRLISNSAWSSFGMKFLSATMNSGTLDSRTRTAKPAIDARDGPSTIRAAAYRSASTAWKIRESFDECLSLPCASTFSQRAASIGVSVKLTSSDTMMANAIVNPKLFMKRPTMPPMKPTGHEDRDQRQRRRQHGQADFARGLHGRGELVDVLLLDEAIDVLQHDDRVVDDDADRQRQREHRHGVQREAHVPHQPERGDDRRRNRDRRDDRRAQVGEEQQHDERGQERADDEMLFDAVDRRFDELRQVAHDARVVARRQRRADLVEPLADGLHDLDGVRARLTAHVEQDRAACRRCWRPCRAPLRRPRRARRR